MGYNQNNPRRRRRWISFLFPLVFLLIFALTQSYELPRRDGVLHQSWNRWCEELVSVRLASQQGGQIVISLRERRA